MITTKHGSEVTILAPASDWVCSGKRKKQVEVEIICETGYYRNIVLVDNLVGDVGQGELFEGEG